jgi:hypothetical protein
VAQGARSRQGRVSNAAQEQDHVQGEPRSRPLYWAAHGGSYSLGTVGYGLPAPHSCPGDTPGKHNCTPEEKSPVIMC